MQYFDNAKINDRVWDYVWREGKITGIYKQLESISVKFDLLRDDKSFSLEGKMLLFENQRLFYYDNRPIVITQDDLDISADSGSYRLSSLGIDQITKEKSEFGAYGNSGCNFKDYNYSKYTRTVRREEPKEFTEETLEKIEKLCKKYEIKCPECGTKSKIFWLHPNYTFYHCDNCNHEWWNEHKSKIKEPKRPPLGLRPKHIAKNERITEIREALHGLLQVYLDK